MPKFTAKTRPMLDRIIVEAAKPRQEMRNNIKWKSKQNPGLRRNNAKMASAVMMFLLGYITASFKSYHAFGQAVLFIAFLCVLTFALLAAVRKSSPPDRAPSFKSPKIVISMLIIIVALLWYIAVNPVALLVLLFEAIILFVGLSCYLTTWWPPNRDSKN